tara:strand:+ start:281 stop:499 length:219 start_codon:yes stop_codon:yes gene_type:complete
MTFTQKTSREVATEFKSEINFKKASEIFRKSEINYKKAAEIFRKSDHYIKMMDLYPGLQSSKLNSENDQLIE